MSRYDEITYLGRNNPEISFGQHIRQMRQVNLIPIKEKDNWYKEGLKHSIDSRSYLESYFGDRWKSEITNDELLSNIMQSAEYSEMLYIAGRRIAELLDEIEELKKQI